MQICAVTSCYLDSSKVLDLTLVFDSSGSVGYLSWTQFQNIASSIFNSLSIGRSATQIAVVIYGTDANVAFHFGHHLSSDALVAAIWNMTRQAGRKNLNQALYLLWSDVYAAGRGSRPGVSRIGVIITDGEDTENTDQTLLNAAKCKVDNSIRLMVLSAASSAVNLPRLSSVASPGPQNYLRVADYQQLVTVLASYVGSVDHCQSTATSMSTSTGNTPLSDFPPPPTAESTTTPSTSLFTSIPSTSSTLSTSPLLPSTTTSAPSTAAPIIG